MTDSLDNTKDKEKDEGLSKEERRCNCDRREGRERRKVAYHQGPERRRNKDRRGGSADRRDNSAEK